MFGQARIDPLARQAATAIAAGRLALGAGALLTPGPALKALGFSEINGTSLILTQLAGTRDIALALLTIAARDDLRALRTATAVSAAVDAVDAVSLGLAGRGDPARRRAGVVGVASGGAAALAGLWARRRLG